MSRESMGTWADNIQAFYFGGMDIEYIARKGSHQVFIYPCGKYPAMPEDVIQHTKRIESVEDFDDALTYGLRYKAKYEHVGTGAFGD